MNRRRPPDIEGPRARAWLVPNRIAKPDHAASLACYLVNAPHAHPAWQWWRVCVIHLRDIPGVKPAHKRYPAAEYEFMIYAIDPTTRPEPDPDNPEEGWPYLVPIDVIEQFHGVSDRDAVRVCHLAVTAIANGFLSPDQDYRTAWRGCLAATVADFASGTHLES